MAENFQHNGRRDGIGDLALGALEAYGLLGATANFNGETVVTSLRDKDFKVGISGFPSEVKSLLGYGKDIDFENIPAQAYGTGVDAFTVGGFTVMASGPLSVKGDDYVLSGTFTQGKDRNDYDPKIAGVRGALAEIATRAGHAIVGNNYVDHVMIGQVDFSIKGKTPAYQEGISTSFAERDGVVVTVKCFPATTLILLADSTSALISAISPGDIVLAFSPVTEQGRGALVPARVTRLMRNVTGEWLVVRPAPGFEAIAAANGFTELTVTPGHETLDAQGRFRPIIDILNDEAELVLADGTVMRVVHERVVHEREDVMPQAFIAAQALASRTKPSTGISSARAVG